MPHNTDADTNDMLPSTRERADALHLIKKFAREGYTQMMGTDGSFEELWRTAFDVDPQPSDSEKDSFGK